MIRWWRDKRTIVEPRVQGATVVSRAASSSRCHYVAPIHRPCLGGAATKRRASKPQSQQFSLAAPYQCQLTCSLKRTQYKAPSVNGNAKCMSTPKRMTSWSIPHDGRKVTPIHGTRSGSAGPIPHMHQGPCGLVFNRLKTRPR